MIDNFFEIRNLLNAPDDLDDEKIARRENQLNFIKELIRYPFSFNLTDGTVQTKVHNKVQFGGICKFFNSTIKHLRISWNVLSMI